jgi:hypothetical protein
MKITAIMIGVAGLATVALTGCGSQASHNPAAAPTVTHTVISPGPTVTQTITRPGPTVTSTVYAPAPSQNSGGTPAPPPGTNQVIVRFSGTSSQNTATFTTPVSWHLSWAYWGCPSGTANFIVTEYNPDGSPDPNGVSVNELGTGRGPVATYAYGDAGTHYLSVNTEGCSWSLVPVTG